jgi:CO/xanthine dehydrogenase Mo-binding subunit
VAYTGQSLKRFEDPRLLTGHGAFLDDLTFPDMVYAAVLRSPHAHAHIRAIDTVAARHTPGVVAVITADDLTEVAEPLPTRRETEAQERVCPTFYTRSGPGICGPCSINSATSRERYFIA